MRAAIVRMSSPYGVRDSVVSPEVLAVLGVHRTIEADVNGPCDAVFVGLRIDKSDAGHVSRLVTEPTVCMFG